MLLLEETEELQVNEWWSDEVAEDTIRFRCSGFFFHFIYLKTYKVSELIQKTFNNSVNSNKKENILSTELILFYKKFF